MKQIIQYVSPLVALCALAQPTVSAPPSAAVATIYVDAGPVVVPTGSPADVYSRSLGPTFADLNPGAIDTRPTLFTHPDIAGTIGHSRVLIYQIGGAAGQHPDTDFWSESGQVDYVPDGTIPNDPGVDRIQTFAYDSHTYDIRIHQDGSINRTGPEPYLSDYFDRQGNNIAPGKLVDQTRGSGGLLCNEALAVFENGIISGMGTATSRDGWPIGIEFLPANKIPHAIALTTSNEFALIALTDSTTGKGQLAVVACEGKWLGSHTMPWMGLPNQGSWSDLMILGYVDLPFNNPDHVSAASNGFWQGASSTQDYDAQGQLEALDMGRLDIVKYRAALRQGDLGWQKVIASSGYAIVTSRVDGKAAVVDLTPLFAYFKNAYLSDTQQPITLAARAAKTFPAQLDSANMPTIFTTLDLPNVTTSLCGQLLDRWSTDVYKAYIAQESGLITILDTSRFMARFDFEASNPFAVIGTVQVGRNPVSLALARFSPWQYLTLNPPSASGTPTDDPLNNLLYAACRGDRRIDAVETRGGQGRVYQTLQDSRLGDPVYVAVCGRGNLVFVADYLGKKVGTFRIGTLADHVLPWQNPPLIPEYFYIQPASDGSVQAEYYEYHVAGNPRRLTSANVN